jgi:hypothetical protein
MSENLSIEDIRKEPLIHKMWKFKKANPTSFSDELLVTGPNSFVGVHVIKQLKTRWSGRINLLLRASNKEEAVEKMENAFSTWKLGPFEPDKYSIYLGDVGLNLMGLRASEHLQLNKKTGFVLHMAMNPLYHLPYAHFKRLWLPELARMIIFCGFRENLKSLHYPTSYNANFFTTDNDFQHLNANAWQSGYAGFKWVASQVLSNAFKQNLNGCLYDIPLVVGSQETGLCPAHYSIWHILDMFLKTGYYIPFAFKIIPVDVLAEIIVSNLLADKEGNGTRFTRPVLDEAITDVQFSNTVANILGLRKTTPEILREAYYSKHRFDFMFPPAFYDLTRKVNDLPAVLPGNYDKQKLPSAQMVFLSNLNQILSKKLNETEIE